MPKKIYFIILLILPFITTGCLNNQKSNENLKENNSIKESEFNNMEDITDIKININGKNYDATLENNATAHALVELFPLEFEMSELNGNEKYIYMNKTFPTNPTNPQKIVAGDIMLYGNDCLVIFYKSFNTSYSYTKVGHINNLPDLGNDKATVKFEK